MDTLKFPESSGLVGTRSPSSSVFDEMRLHELNTISWFRHSISEPRNRVSENGNGVSASPFLVSVRLSAALGFMQQKKKKVIAHYYKSRHRDNFKQERFNARLQTLAHKFILCMKNANIPLPYGVTAHQRRHKRDITYKGL